MVAATQARTLTVGIKRNTPSSVTVDWSQEFLDLTIGFESYSQGTGLILKRGTIRLCNIKDGTKILDPRSQSDFDVGARVYVDWNGSDHPLAGELRILAPPSVDLIDDSLPAIEGNYIISIPVGCNLAYWRSNEVDDDKTGVTLGNPLAISTVVTNLINAASPNDSKVISIGFGSSFNMGFPYSKNGGSYIDLAGEIAYCAGRPPTPDDQTPLKIPFLYCDIQNYIQNSFLYRDIARTFPTTITLGTNDREYLPQIDSSFSPGIVRISGVKRNVIDTTADYPFTDIVKEYSESPVELLSAVATSYYKEDNGSLAYQFDRLYRVYFQSTGSTSGLSLPLFSPPKTKVVGLENRYTYNATFANEYIGTDLSSVTVLGEFYKDEKLTYTIDAKFVISQTMFPDGWEDVGDDDFQKVVLNNSETLHPSEVTIVSYKFNGDEISERTTLVCSNLFLIDRNADFETEFAFAFTEGSRLNGRMLLKQRTIEKWTRVKDRYLLSTTTSVPKIVNDPNYVSEQEDVGLARNDRYLLQSKLTRTKERELEPPAITYWSGKYTIEEENLSSSVTFGTGTNSKELSIQMPFVFDESQLDSYAKIEGEIINGRQYQHLIECDPSLFATVTEPMTGIKVIEPTGNKFFLCDALTWYHSQYEDYVGFAGIYVGSGITGSTFPGQKPQAIVGNEDIEATIGLTGTIAQDVLVGSIYD